jgi:hypothetical protein
LLRQLLECRAEKSPPQSPAEHIAQDGVPKQRFLIPFIIGHEFLLVWFT